MILSRYTKLIELEIGVDTEKKRMAEYFDSRGLL